MLGGGHRQLQLEGLTAALCLAFFGLGGPLLAPQGLEAAAQPRDVLHQPVVRHTVMTLLMCTATQQYNSLQQRDIAEGPTAMRS